MRRRPPTRMTLPWKCAWQRAFITLLRTPFLKVNAMGRSKRRKRWPIGFWALVRFKLSHGRSCTLMLYVTPKAFKDYFTGPWKGVSAAGRARRSL